MPMYLFCDGEATEVIYAESLDEARKLAEEWLRDGISLGPTEGPIWCEASVRRLDENGEVVEGPGAEEATVRVRIDPPEPECSGGQHDWRSPWEVVGGLRENPGVWGHDGGVRIHEVCVRCGWHRIEDTWYRDDRGQPTVAFLYREPDEDSLEWVARQRETE